MGPYVDGDGCSDADRYHATFTLPRAQPDDRWDSGAWCARPALQERRVSRRWFKQSRVAIIRSQAWNLPCAR